MRPSESGREESTEEPGYTGKSQTAFFLVFIFLSCWNKIFPIQEIKTG
jgi:hypothetical protein